jgi:8-oxo-dGTP pyrophosphatase MutT (NUDIX family)
MQASAALKTPVPETSPRYFETVDIPEKLPAIKSLAEVMQEKLHPTWDPHPNYKKRAYGGVVVRLQGNELQLLLREPSNHFDNYHWTFAKGKMDRIDEHPAETALREVQEETGYEVAIFDTLPGTFTSNEGGTRNNYYLMQALRESSKGFDWETNAVRWANQADASKLINQTVNIGGRKRDLAVLQAAFNFLRKS